jgi:hypothetical protein
METLLTAGVTVDGVVGVASSMLEVIELNSCEGVEKVISMGVL